MLDFNLQGKYKVDCMYNICQLPVAVAHVVELLLLLGQVSHQVEQREQQAAISTLAFFCRIAAKWQQQSGSNMYKLQ